MNEWLVWKKIYIFLFKVIHLVDEKVCSFVWWEMYVGWWWMVDGLRWLLCWGLMKHGRLWCWCWADDDQQMTMLKIWMCVKCIYSEKKPFIIIIITKKSTLNWNSLILRFYSFSLKFILNVLLLFHLFLIRIRKKRNELIIY